MPIFNKINPFSSLADRLSTGREARKAKPGRSGLFQRDRSFRLTPATRFQFKSNSPPYEESHSRLGKMVIELAKTYNQRVAALYYETDYDSSIATIVASPGKQGAERETNLFKDALIEQAASNGYELLSN